MTARERAAQLWCLPQHSHKPMDVEFAESIADALADAERGVWRDVWNESVRIQGNGSPMTDFGKGVIAATKDIQAFICEQSEAQAGEEG